MRLSKKQRIINYAVNNGYNETTLKYLSLLIDISKNGMIDRYITEKHVEIIKNCFGNDATKASEAYILLVKDKIIESKGITLYILAWDDEHLYCLNHNLPKRKYSKSVIREQTSIVDNNTLKDVIEASGYSRSVPEPDTKGNITGEIKIDWNKLIGIKFSREFAGLLTGEPLSSEGKSRLTPEQIIKEEEKRNLSKEERRYLLGLMSQCNSEGKIYDYNQLFSITKMQELFDDGTLAVSTCYDVHKKLIAKGIIEEYTYKNGIYTCLKLIGYEDGYGKGRNYVVIPYAVFQKIFKQLKTKSIKLFFKFIFMLNNGEDKKNPGINKKVYFKVRSTTKDTTQDKVSFNNKLRWLNCRCNSEIEDAVYGNKNNLALQQFFDIENDGRKNGMILIKIKDKYFVAKNTVKRIVRIFDPLERYAKRAKLIREILEKNCSFIYSSEDVRSFVIIFKKECRRVIELLIRTLDIDIKNRRQNGWGEVRSLGAYMHSLYKKYLQGDRVLIQSNIANYFDTHREALEKLSNDECDIEGEPDKYISFYGKEGEVEYI